MLIGPSALYTVLPVRPCYLCIKCDMAYPGPLSTERSDLLFRCLHICVEIPLFFF